MRVAQSFMKKYSEGSSKLMITDSSTPPDRNEVPHDEVAPSSRFPVRNTMLGNASSPSQPQEINGSQLRSLRSMSIQRRPGSGRDHDGSILQFLETEPGTRHPSRLHRLPRIRLYAHMSREYRRNQISIATLATIR
jgi:hypothetical protein